MLSNLWNPQTSSESSKDHSTNPAHYHLLVTTGPSKDPQTHVPVNINSAKPTKFTVNSATGVNLNVGIRVLIKNHEESYDDKESENGAKRYFEEEEDHREHTYSIQFTLTPEKGEGEGRGGRRGISFKSLLWGNDFDHPIRYNLPPGFGAALSFVKWVIDPGIVDDVYADEPYLFGPLLSSVNYVCIEEQSDTRLPPLSIATIENMSPLSHLTSPPIPSDPKLRRKHFLNEANRQAICIPPSPDIGKGYTYSFDFCNGFLDFNSFALRIPHFSIPILKYWDGQPLRYVLKHKYALDGEEEKEEVLFVVVFQLVENQKGDNEEGEEEEIREDIKGAEEDIAKLEVIQRGGSKRDRGETVDRTMAPLSSNLGGGGDDDVD